MPTILVQEKLWFLTVKIIYYIKLGKKSKQLL